MLVEATHSVCSSVSRNKLVVYLLFRDCGFIFRLFLCLNGFSIKLVRLALNVGIEWVIRCGHQHKRRIQTNLHMCRLITMTLTTDGTFEKKEKIAKRENPFKINAKNALFIASECTTEWNSIRKRRKRRRKTRIENTHTDTVAHRLLRSHVIWFILAAGSIHTEVTIQPRETCLN